jgi:hypothetical protein
MLKNIYLLFIMIYIKQIAINSKESSLMLEKQTKKEKSER